MEIIADQGQYIIHKLYNKIGFQQLMTAKYDGHYYCGKVFHKPCVCGRRANNKIPRHTYCDMCGTYSYRNQLCYDIRYYSNIKICVKCLTIADKKHDRAMMLLPIIHKLGQLLCIDIIPQIARALFAIIYFT